MIPWLPNLIRYYRLTNEPESAARVQKTKEVINQLVEFTIRVDIGMCSLSLSLSYLSLSHTLRYCLSFLPLFGRQSLMLRILEVVLDCLITLGIQENATFLCTEDVCALSFRSQSLPFISHYLTLPLSLSLFLLAFILPPSLALSRPLSLWLCPPSVSPSCCLLSPSSFCRWGHWLYHVYFMCEKSTDSRR